MKTFNESISPEKLSSDILKKIPEDTSSEDFALAIITIMKDEYGKHNFKSFLKILNDKLK